MPFSLKIYMQRMLRDAKIKAEQRRKEPLPANVLEAAAYEQKIAISAISPTALSAERIKRVAEVETVSGRGMTPADLQKRIEGLAGYAGMEHPAGHDARARKARAIAELTALFAKYPELGQAQFGPEKIEFGGGPYDWAVAHATRPLAKPGEEGVTVIQIIDKQYHGGVNNDFHTGGDPAGVMPRSPMR